MNYAITAEGLSVTLGGSRVIDRLSLAVPTGSIFGLLGPSGAGKTTLIKLLTGQLRQDEGSAALLGTDTRQLTAREHRQTGAMLDHYGLYERLSVYDNLAFYAELCRVPHGIIPDLLKSIGLYEARKRAVSRLSKGMKNRLSLARALMNRPKLLFLDEPTSGLDPAATKAIHAILLKQKKQGATIFLTTHNMFEAESLCDEAALLSKGRIIERGRPADICRRYDHLNRLHITLRDGSEALLENNGSAAPILTEYLEKGLLAAIHSTEPTLETAFIELTGKGLEQDAQYCRDF